MKTSAASVPHRSGFTLIELLTVIGIIAVLMTLLFPAVNAVKENARRMEAKNMCMQIVTAVKQYYQEYGKFPPVDADPTQPSTPVGQDTILGDPETMSAAKLPNNYLFNTLRAIDKTPNDMNKYNPRKVIFFESKAVASVSGSKPRGGFYDRSTTNTPSPAEEGALFDPWGHQYGVIMDTNYDNRIDLTGVYSDFAGADKDSGLAPRQTVGAFSVGKDETVGKKGGGPFYKQGTETSDDVISWQ
jgi:prepilin-type N-terminal cleavage/methylation domain-containing protein